MQLSLVYSGPIMGFLLLVHWTTTLLALQQRCCSWMWYLYYRFSRQRKIKRSFRQILRNFAWQLQDK
jgi:hypothetical protein